MLLDPAASPMTRRSQERTRRTIQKVAVSDADPLPAKAFASFLHSMPLGSYCGTDLVVTCNHLGSLLKRPGSDHFCSRGILLPGQRRDSLGGVVVVTPVAVCNPRQAGVRWGS